MNHARNTKLIQEEKEEEEKKYIFFTSNIFFFLSRHHQGADSWYKTEKKNFEKPRLRRHGECSSLVLSPGLKNVSKTEMNLYVSAAQCSAVRCR